LVSRKRKKLRKLKKGEAAKHRLRNLMAKNTKTKKINNKVTDKEEISKDEKTPLKRYEKLRKMEFIQVASA